MAALRPILFSEGRWRWGWQILLYLPLVAAAAGLLVGPAVWLSLAAGWLPPPNHPIRTWPGALSLSLIQLLLYAAVLGATDLAQRWLRRSSLGALGLQRCGPWLGELVLGVGLGGLALLISIGLAALAGWYHVLGWAWEARPWGELGPALVVGFFNNVQPGLLEEVIFRGYLFQVLEARFSTPTAVLGSSAAFALAHFGSLGDDVPIALVMLSLFAIGCVQAQAYLVRRSLWLPIGLHFIWDWGIGLFGSVGRPAASAWLLVTAVSGPAWLQGPQKAGAGVFDLIGFAVVALCLRALRRRAAPALYEQRRLDYP